MSSPYVPQVPGETGAPDADAPPSILVWARVYAGLLTLTYVGIALLGILMATGGVFAATKTGTAKGAPGMIVQGVMFAVIGGVFTIPGGLAIWAPRKKWTWFLHMFLLGKGVMTCCLPMALPIFLSWMKPEVRKYYDA